VDSFIYYNNCQLNMFDRDDLTSTRDMKIRYDLVIEGRGDCLSYLMDYQSVISLTIRPSLITSKKGLIKQNIH
jgi:hypothetical protein